MLMLIAIRTQVDTRIHPVQPYIKKDMFIEVGKGDASPTFVQVLESLLAKGEYLTFAPDTIKTRMMINILSAKFPLLQLQQVIDSFVTYASQQTTDKLGAEDTDSPSLLTFDQQSALKFPWTLFSPSNIRMAPFPTREYTDDEFQSIVKNVMGVFQVPFGISLSGITFDQLFSV